MNGKVQFFPFSFFRFFSFSFGQRQQAAGAHSIASSSSSSSSSLFLSLSFHKNALDIGPAGEGNSALGVQRHQGSSSGDERGDAEKEECRSFIFAFGRDSPPGVGDDGDGGGCSPFRCVVAGTFPFFSFRLLFFPSKEEGRLCRSVYLRVQRRRLRVSKAPLVFL